jgi:hypothetical protein
LRAFPALSPFKRTSHFLHPQNKPRRHVKHSNKTLDAYIIRGNPIYEPRASSLPLTVRLIHIAFAHISTRIRIDVRNPCPRGLFGCCLSAVHAVALRKNPRGPVPMLCSLIELRNSTQCLKYINHHFCLVTNVQSAPESTPIHSLLLRLPDLPLSLCTIGRKSIHFRSQSP